MIPRDQKRRASRLLLVENLERRSFLSGSTNITFDRVEIDGPMIVSGNARGPKALADINGDGLVDAICNLPGQGTYWYEAPTYTRYKMNSNGSAHLEGGEAADVDNDGD